MRVSRAPKRQRAHLEVGPAVTEVAFHFNAPDKLAYACRFARKLARSDHWLLITGSQQMLDTLDTRLWGMEPSDFVAHCRGDSPAQLLVASPVVLSPHPHQGGRHDVLLNLGDDIPVGFGSYQRLVEVVSADDPQDRERARARWHHYAQRGYAIVRHDLILKN